LGYLFSPFKKLLQLVLKSGVKYFFIGFWKSRGTICWVFFFVLSPHISFCWWDFLRMVIAAAVIVPLGLLFFISGLAVNLFQAVCYVLIRPLSKNTYRKINRVVAETLWLELVWIVDWWAGVKIQVFADNETFNRMGKEHALVVCNHRSDIDWLVGWILAQRSGCLGSALAVMKKSSKFLPVIGWSMWFSEYLFLERNWLTSESCHHGNFSPSRRNFSSTGEDCRFSFS
jgi:hypothetical protein